MKEYIKYMTTGANEPKPVAALQVGLPGIGPPNLVFCPPSL